MAFNWKGDFAIQRGLGLPQHTTASRLAYIPSEEGYIVYDTDLDQIFFYLNEWIPLNSSVLRIKTIATNTTINSTNYKEYVGALIQVTDNVTITIDDTIPLPEGTTFDFIFTGTNKTNVVVTSANLLSERGSTSLEPNTRFNVTKLTTDYIITGRLQELLYVGNSYKVEDYPLIWQENTLYDIAANKGNYFTPNADYLTSSSFDYRSISTYDIHNNALTTDITETLLIKFPNLASLKCQDNNISVLEVSNSTSLTQLYCYNNNISILDVSNLVLLTQLHCYNNSISILDVAGLTSLTQLSCGDNNITVLNVTNLTSLTQLTCYNNNIAVLDVSNLTLLTQLSCDNNNLSTLDVANLTLLTHLYCHSNTISVLDVSNLTLLRHLDCYNNNISILDVTNLTALTILGCDNNSISVLDVSNLTALTSLHCNNNNISVLDVANLISLTGLFCSNNTISTLDVSNVKLLTNLSCENNLLDGDTNSQILIDLDGHGLSNGYLNSSIFGTGFITPTGIDSFNALLSKSWNIVGLTNQINAGTTYNVEDFPKIWIDDLYYNTYKGDTFVASANTLMTGQIEYDAVTLISLYSQSLTTDFTSTLLGKFSNLSNLRCYNNQISVLDVSQLISLRKLYCDTNQISVLDVSQLVNLTYLNCYTNQISVLDVSQLVNLDSLICYNNQITTLDVSQLVNLDKLYCHNNQIATLDVSQLVNLNNLQCQNNQLDAATNSQILVDLDNNGLSNGYFISSIFGGGSLTAAGQTAKTNLLSKGWTILGI